MFNEDSDTHALLLGFISISYLAMIFLSFNWKTSIICLSFNTIIVFRFFTVEMQLAGKKLLPAFLLFIFTLGLVLINIELRDKKEFLEYHNIKRL